MNKWSNLPNAKHIDWVLQSLKDNPDEWNMAYDAAYNAALGAAYNAAYDAARDTVWSAARDTVWSAAWAAAYDTALGSARYAARAAVLALAAYDDIEHYFLSSYEELRLISELSQHPATTLLLPAVRARELIEAKHEQVV